MHKITLLMAAIALAFVPVLLAAPAQAASLNHTWVASAAAGGNDGNNCDLPTPCATFQGAFGKTTNGGEITCVDSSNYGSIQINMSITINCENAIGSSSGMYVNGSDVVLRGLDLDGGGTTGSICDYGGLIFFNGDGALHVEKVKINHINGSCDGILIAPQFSATVDVTDCDITDNGVSGTGAGIYIAPSSGMQTNVSIKRTQIENNYFGVVADGTGGGIIRGTVIDSVVSGNVNNGITVSSSGSNVVLLIDQTKVAGNNFGLVATGSNAGMLVRNTSVVANATGLDTGSGGVLYSYGNNSVNGNTTTHGTFTGVVGQK